MPVTFQVVGNLADFGNDPLAGVKIRAYATPTVKISDTSVHSNQPEQAVTDVDGSFTLTLVSLPGVWYKIQSAYTGAIRPVNLAGYVPDSVDPTTGEAFPDGTVIDLIDVVDESPTPGYEAIAYLGGSGGTGDVTTAQLNAEAAARAAGDAALDVRVDVLEAAPGPDVTAADLAGHAADTTAVHGISDTSALVVTTDPRLTDARTPTTHTHDDRYFTEAEVTTALAGKSNTGHAHATSDVTGLTAALAGKAATSHSHVIADTTGLQAALDGKQAAGSYAATSHDHDSRYVVVVEHGAVAGTARPAGAAVVLWVGSVEPTNAEAGDQWDDATGSPAVYVEDDDPRLTDARTPTAHTHPVTDLTATGTRDATTFLRGDNTWATPAGGGGGGSVAADTLWNAKGDLAVGTGSDAASRLGVGTNGYVLTADSAEATGVKWAAAAGGLDTEGVQDVVGAMVAAAGGSYDDGAGTITLPSGGSGDGWTYVIATVDTSNSTLSDVNVTGLALTGLADGLYEFEARILGTSTAFGTGVRTGLSWPASAPVALYQHAVGTNATTGAFIASNSSSSPVQGQAAHGIATGALHLAATMSGVFRAASMSGSIQVTVRTETDAQSVTVKADSFIRYRRISA